MPANVAAEQALLGALLTNNKAFEKVCDFLEPRHFIDPVHELIFERIAVGIQRGQVMDAITLRGELENDPTLEPVGGGRYMAELLTAMIGIINAGDYGRAIRDAWIRRQIIDLVQVMGDRAFLMSGQDMMSAEDQIEAAEASLYELASSRGESSKTISFEQALDTAIQGAEAAYLADGYVTGITSGFLDLDRKTGGLHASDLVILAGRPGMGKTALATKIAVSAARSLAPAEAGQKPAGVVAFFSLEMRADQIASRVLAEESRVQGERLRRGEIGQKEFDRFVAVRQELAALPLVFDDTAALSITALRSRCRRLSRTKGLKLVVVDYLQLMRSPLNRPSDNRVLEIGMITQGLKAIAKDFDVPVLALSQLSRGVESREDKRPQLSDLRDSGSIEQDADAVMFVYRDEYYLQQRQPKQTAYASDDKYQAALEKWQQDMERVRNKAELLLEKQRHGPTGTIQLLFEAAFTRFADLSIQDMA